MKLLQEIPSLLTCVALTIAAVFPAEPYVGPPAPQVELLNVKEEIMAIAEQIRKLSDRIDTDAHLKWFHVRYEFDNYNADFTRTDDDDDGPWLDFSVSDHGKAKKKKDKNEGREE